MLLKLLIAPISVRVTRDTVKQNDEWLLVLTAFAFHRSH